MMTGTNGPHNPRMARRLALCVLAGMAAIGLAPSGLGAALARVQPHPRLFALSATAFPPGSRVVRSGIETNTQLVRDEASHFGLPPTALGRLTGYYMDAVEGDPAIHPHPYTSYLVSIFPSRRQARMAYDLRWDTWYRTEYYTAPTPIGITLGDRGEQALFRTLNPQETQVSELFFRKGAVLVEVFQGIVGPESTPAQLHSLYAIATELSQLAGSHPYGI